MSKRIIILGASLYYVNVIKSIKKLGYYVIVLDKNKNSPGFEFADEYKAIDIFDRFAVYSYSKEKNIDGIMAINDFGTRSAFYTSQKLGLVNPSYLTGICGNDKGIMRDIWSHDGLPQPKYMIFSSDTDSELIEKNLSYPMVIKPTDAGGAGRGISIANNIYDLKESIAHAGEFVKNNRFIAEEFIEGIEVTVDSLVYKGEVYSLAISDKEKPISKYFVATSLNFPANFSHEIISQVKKIVKQATESFGISNGATHAELIVNGDDIKLVEIGIRGGGGHLFNTIVETISGINAPQELAKILCNDAPNLKIKKEQGACYRFFNPQGKGTISSIKYDEELIKSDFIVDFGITAKVGDRFKGLVDSMKRVGFVVTKGIDRDEALKNADLVENNIIFKFKD